MGISPMTCMEPAEQDGARHWQWYKLGSSRLSCYQEDSLHVSVNQRGRKSLDLFSTVGFLRQTRSRYLRCILEAKMSGVTHGLTDFGEIFLVISGAWRLNSVQRTLSHCWASPVTLMLRYLISPVTLMLRYLISPEVLTSGFKASILVDNNFRYLIVCGTVRLWFNGICKSATTEKYSEIKWEVDIERTLHPIEKQIIRSRDWPRMCVEKSTYWWRSKDFKIPNSFPVSDYEESMRRMKSPISARLWGSVDM